jgi:hypothetical protein
MAEFIQGTKPKGVFTNKAIIKAYQNIISVINVISLIEIFDYVSLTL